VFSISLEQVEHVIKGIGFSIIYFDSEADFPAIPHSLHLVPNDKGTITVEEVREFSSLFATKQAKEIICIVEQADKMTDVAANALLKFLEEPGANIHISFFIVGERAVLPTIRSRAHVFTAKSTIDFDKLQETDETIIKSAKELISATPHQLISLSSTLAKDRERTTKVVNAAIDIAYKSYFKTNKQQFISLLERLMKLSEAISANGHIRLHLIADMI